MYVSADVVGRCWCSWLFLGGVVAGWCCQWAMLPVVLLCAAALVGCCFGLWCVLMAAGHGCLAGRTSTPWLPYPHVSVPLVPNMPPMCPNDPRPSLLLPCSPQHASHLPTSACILLRCPPPTYPEPQVPTFVSACIPGVSVSAPAPLCPAPSRRPHHRCLRARGDLGASSRSAILRTHHQCRHSQLPQRRDDG